MIDRNNAIRKINNFLEDENKRILLVKGYDNRAKVNAVLNCLNKKFKQGILKTSSMQDIPFLINSSFKNKVLPNNVISTKVYKIGNMKVKISKYSGRTVHNPIGNKNTFTLYHPVQLALNDPKQYSNLLEDIKRSDSGKIILITTNEWSIENWDIENHVDQVIFYSVENDNPQLMENLRRNGVDVWLNMFSKEGLNG